jgi:hypothetical protein
MINKAAAAAAAVGAPKASKASKAIKVSSYKSSSSRGARTTTRAAPAVVQSAAHAGTFFTGDIGGRCAQVEFI